MQELHTTRKERVLERVSLSSLHSNLKPHGSCTCLFCGRKNKGFCYQDKYYKCYSSRCGIQGNAISIFMKLNGLEGASSFYLALTELEKSLGINTDYKSLISERVKVYEEALDIYKYILMDTKEGVVAREYLSERGFNEVALRMYDIGYAPTGNPLKSYGLDDRLLSKHGLFNAEENQEYYSNRIMFPIRDTSKRVIHFTGRYCGDVPKDEFEDDLYPRYKDSRSSEGIPSTKSYLVFEDHIESYLNIDPHNPWVILTEGYPDSLTLKQYNIPVLGLLGLEGLVKQFSKLEKLKTVICVFDNDFFDVDFPKEELRGQYKSWIKIIPQLVELQQILPHVRFYTWMVPDYVNKKRTKDVNDFIITSKLTPQEIRDLILSEKQDLIEQVIERWGPFLDKHIDLLRLIHSTNRGATSLNKYVSAELKFSDPINYALRVLGS